MSFVATVDVSLRPSIRALQCIFFLHGIPVAALPFAMRPGLPMIALLLCFGGSWLWVRRHPVFGFGPKALVRLVWHEDGRWTVYAPNGAHSDAVLLPHGYRHPALLVLNFQLADGRRRTRVLLGDEADEESLRRLRARLAVTPDAAPDP
jgi:toxin CptA